MEYTSGNEIVDRLSTMNFSGNIIPPIWFKTITKDNGKPYLLAIVILSEIVYWYRPVEKRDEETGEFIGYQTKFNKDLLQKSYQNLAEYYQVSKRQVTAAIITLEKIGVVKRVFRDVTRGGKLYNNVLFIKLYPDKLRELTYPQRVELKTDVENAEQKNEGPSHKKMCDPPTKNCDTPPTKKCDYTKINNTKTTNSNYNLFSSSVCRKEFCEQIGYEQLKTEFCESSIACTILEQCVDIAVSVLSSTKRKIRVNREWESVYEVREKLKKLKIVHMRFVVTEFLNNKTKINQIRSYLLTCMVNSIYGMDIKGYVVQNAGANNRTKNKFHKFPQREYAKGEMSDLEKKLLGGKIHEESVERI